MYKRTTNIDHNNISALINCEFKTQINLLLEHYKAAITPNPIFFFILLCMITSQSKFTGAYKYEYKNILMLMFYLL